MMNRNWINKSGETNIIRFSGKLTKFPLLLHSILCIFLFLSHFPFHSRRNHIKNLLNEFFILISILFEGFMVSPFLLCISFTNYRRECNFYCHLNTFLFVSYFHLCFYTLRAFPLIPFLIFPQIIFASFVSNLSHLSLMITCVFASAP